LRRKIISGKIMALLLLSILLVIVTISVAFAYEKCNLSITVGSKTATKGDKVNIPIEFNSNVEIANFDLVVTYDKEFLQFNSIEQGSPAKCVDNGDGTLRIYADTISGMPLTITLEFKTLAIGEGVIRIREDYELYPADYATYGVNPGATIKNGKVTIKAPYQASSDCKLKSLVVSEGTLSPAFSKDKTEYTVSVGGGCNKLGVTAVANDSKASVKVSGNKDLKEGENTVKITVTAENGDTKTYKIKVTRGKMSPTPTPTTGVTVNVNDTELILRDKISVEAPEDFEKGTFEYGDFTVECLKNLAGNLTVVEMSDGNLYVYNPENDSFYLYEETKGKANRYIFVQYPVTLTVPEGYYETTKTVEGKERKVYINAEESSYCILYMMNYAGESDWYQYDLKEQSIQRLNQEQADPTPTPIPTDTPTPTPTAVPTNTPTPVPTMTVAPTPTLELIAGRFTPKQALLGSLLAVVLFFVAMIVFLVLFLVEKNRHATEESADASDEESTSEAMADQSVTEDVYSKAVEEADEEMEYEQTIVNVDELTLGADVTSIMEGENTPRDEK